MGTFGQNDPHSYHIPDADVTTHCLRQAGRSSVAARSSLVRALPKPGWIVLD